MLEKKNEKNTLTDGLGTRATVAIARTISDGQIQLSDEQGQFSDGQGQFSDDQGQFSDGQNQFSEGQGKFPTIRDNLPKAICNIQKANALHGGTLLEGAIQDAHPCKYTIGRRPRVFES